MKYIAVMLGFLLMMPSALEAQDSLRYCQIYALNKKMAVEDKNSGLTLQQSIDKYIELMKRMRTNDDKGQLISLYISQAETVFEYPHRSPQQEHDDALRSCLKNWKY